jgi:hypothetical protein
VTGSVHEEAGRVGSGASRDRGGPGQHRAGQSIMGWCPLWQQAREPRRWVEDRRWAQPVGRRVEGRRRSGCSSVVGSSGVEGASGDGAEGVGVEQK